MSFYVDLYNNVSVLFCIQNVHPFETKTNHCYLGMYTLFNPEATSSDQYNTIYGMFINCESACESVGSFGDNI